MKAGLTDLCRVVVVTPRGPVEMALPASVPICNLLPTLVHHANGGKPNAGDDWVLQRFGETPLDDERTPDELKIRDGETLHLRVRDDALPAVHFDDLIDGVATGMRRRRDHWRDWMTFRAFHISAGLALVIGLAVLVLDGPVAARGIAAGAIAFVLLFAGTICSRALDEASAAVLLAAAAVPYAALSGLLLVTAPLAPTLSAPNLFAAASAGGLAALVSAGAVGVSRPAFLSTVLACLAAVAGGLLVTVAGFAAWQAAAVIGGAAITAGTLIPTVAFSLSRLRLPALPTGPEDLSADIEPYQVGYLLDRTAAADRYMTAMFSASGVVAAAALAMLVPTGGPTTVALVLAMCGVLLLRARAMTSAWQRVSALAPATLGLSLLALHFAGSPAVPVRMYWLAVTLGAAGVLLAFGRMIPGRRLLPYWGRIGDIAEYLVAIAILPLTLGILGVFGWARALAG